MASIEILAPAGGREALIAAVRSGADAVYLGAKAFNARQNAENFDSLSETVAYCHARGVKVHVTVNTLVMDSELDALTQTLREIAAAGADAIITQDLAVAKIARGACPGLALHASTQMTVHNLEGARMCERLGFTRIVLSRELSIREISEICANTPLEVECFVHGALCMSVSGACYLSSMLGGRSGNRGLCAQPCRLDFRFGQRGHALSLKDMCHIPHMQALIDAGVTSLKIEGRMKRPEYVAAAVTACREAREGKAPDLTKLQAVFSRSGFTDGYLTGKRTLEMFGYRTREDVTAAAGVLSELAATYRSEAQRVPVEASLTVGERTVLTVTDGAHTVTASGTPLPSDRLPNGELLARGLQKTGGTPFRMTRTDIQADVPAMLPAGELNRMRRDALEQLLNVRSEINPHFWDEQAEKNCRACSSPTEKPVLPMRMRFETLEQVWDDGSAVIVLPVEAVTPAAVSRFGARLYAELPAVCFPEQLPRLRKTLESVRAMGVMDVTVGNIGLLELGLAYGFCVHGDVGLNLFNAVAADEYARLGLADGVLSFELSPRAVRETAGKTVLPIGQLVYGHLPLMRLRACPKNDCKHCNGQFCLRDRMGIEFPLRCYGKQYVTLHNSVPLYTADQPTQGFRVLYFTGETAQQAAHIGKLASNGEKPDFARTKGIRLQ